MKKNLLILIILITAGLLISTFAVNPILLAADVISVYVNGAKIKAVPAIKEGKSFLPLNTLSSILKTRISYVPGSKVVKVYAKTLRIPSFKKDNIMWLSVKPVVEACGGLVSWDRYNRKLIIITRESKYASKKPSTIKITPLSPTPVIKITPLEPTPEAPATVEAVPTVPTPFMPRSAYNDTVKIIVTDLKERSSVKNYIHPPGFILLSVYISQENISNMTQLYTGSYTLIDENQNIYTPVGPASNFWPIPQIPGAINHGYLTFEVPREAKALQLIYQAPGQAPLAIALTTDLNQ